MPLLLLLLLLLVLSAFAVVPLQDDRLSIDAYETNKSKCRCHYLQ